MSPTYAVPSAATIMSLSDPRASRRQVGVLDDRAVGLDAQQPLRLHRHDEQAPVGQPAEPRRLVVGDLDDRARRAEPAVGELGAHDAVVVHVAETTSAPSCQRGPSPNTRPSTTVRAGASIMAGMVARQVPTDEGRGRRRRWRPRWTPGNREQAAAWNGDEGKLWVEQADHYEASAPPTCPT